MTYKETSRRDFIRQLAIAGGGFLILGKYHFLYGNESDKGILKAIIVDFTKCTGCRTCETVCSSFHHPVIINGESLKGLGNPKLGNIQVYHFNPDIDIPSVCANCPDTPCVNACPVSPDPITGYGAIYRDKITQAIKTNHAECISCGSCSRACGKESTGVIKMNPDINHPDHICNHCDGDPQCIINCPYGALSFAEVNIENAYFGLSPDEIADKLFEVYYGGMEVISE